LQRCAAAILIRAAARSRFAAANGDAIGGALAAAALSNVECRPLGRGRAAASMVASCAVVAIIALMCVRVAAAFLAAPLSGSIPRPSAFSGQPTPAAAPVLRRDACHAAERATRSRRAGPAMSGDPAPVDPALAAALLQLGVARALHDLERLGHGGPRGGSSRVVVRCGRVVPDPRHSWQAQARRRLRRLRSGLLRPDRAAAAAATEAAAAATAVAERVERASGARGTLTLVRKSAEEAVSDPAASSR
jgi:hypothetical protein